MAYRIEIGGRKIFLAQKALSDKGDYIVYEWNDGIFIDDDDDDYENDEDFDDLDQEFDEDDEEYDFTDPDDDDEEDIELEISEEEDAVEEAVRLDIETLLSSGFVPQGGVSAIITPEYTTCYTQAFYREKK